MYVARILYPVRVLGPGNRIGIWFNGCSHGCLGCSNPELWEQQQRYHTTSDTVLKLIRQICRNYPVDGFTLTGGDPFAQPEALELLLPQLRSLSRDVLVYTGFTLGQIQAAYPRCLASIGVLIDGKYLQDRNYGLPLRGSDNQTIHILDSELEPLYSSYLAQCTNEIQNFSTADGVISVGIHTPGYEEKIDSLLKQKGLEII